MLCCTFSWLRNSAVCLQHASCAFLKNLLQLNIWEYFKKKYIFFKYVPSIWRSCDVASCYITYNKNQLDVIIPQIYYWNEILHVSDSSSVHHQEFFIVNTAVVYVIQVCWQIASRIRMELRSILILLASCQQTCMTYTIAVYTVKNSWWWTEELSETCRISFQ